MASYRIAVIPGDGIGPGVVPEGIRVLEAAGRRFYINFTFETFPWSCQTYAGTGRMMPVNTMARTHIPDQSLAYPGYASLN